MKPLDVWLNHYNGHPIILQTYKYGTQAITSRRKECDFVAIIGYNRNEIKGILESRKFTSPMVKMSGNYVAIIPKGEYYG